MVQEQINALESRQLELQAKMASTDAHAAKCVKQGKKFSTQYPDEYAEYLEANEEYNRNEEALAELYLFGTGLLYRGIGVTDPVCGI